ncbi:MAG: sensor histidine kinase [Nocardioides sp.]
MPRRNGLTARLSTAVNDVTRLRSIAYWTAVVVTVLSCWAALVAGSPEVGVLAGARSTIPVVVISMGALTLVAWQLPWAREHMIAMAAAVALAFSPAAPLEAAGAALVYLAIAHDRRDFPWSALLACLAGATVSLVLFPLGTGIAPLGAALVGISLGLLMRSLAHSKALTREARILRARTRASEEQTTWLEQRTALARELHDVVGHHVTAMVVQAEAGQVDEPQAALRAIGALGRTALGELDALVLHLRHPDAPLAMSAPPRLTDTDEILAAPLRRQGVDVHVRLAADLAIDETVELTAYRIVQESLTNVVRHAHAAQVWVEIERSGEQVRIRVSDDGVGPPALSSRGSGLIGIGERVAGLGGVWAVSERPGGGTMIDVFLPDRGDGGGP